MEVSDGLSQTGIDEGVGEEQRVWGHDQGDEWEDGRVGEEERGDEADGREVESDDQSDADDTSGAEYSSSDPESANSWGRVSTEKKDSELLIRGWRGGSKWRRHLKWAG